MKPQGDTILYPWNTSFKREKEGEGRGEGQTDKRDRVLVRITWMIEGEDTYTLGGSINQ